jgi:hypothetical protein
MLQGLGNCVIWMAKVESGLVELVHNVRGVMAWPSRGHFDWFRFCSSHLSLRWKE